MDVSDSNTEPATKKSRLEPIMIELHAPDYWESEDGRMFQEIKHGGCPAGISQLQIVNVPNSRDIWIDTDHQIKFRCLQNPLTSSKEQAMVETCEPTTPAPAADSVDSSMLPDSTNETRPVQEGDSYHGLDFSLPEYEETIPAATVSMSYPESAEAPTNAELPKELSENIDVSSRVHYSTSGSKQPRDVSNQDVEMDVDRDLDLTGPFSSSAPTIRTAPVLISQQPPSSYDVSQLISTLQRDGSGQIFIPPQALYEAIHSVMENREHIIRHNPANTDEIIVYCGGERADSSHLQAALENVFKKSEFQSYNLKTHSVTEPISKYCTPYGPPGQNFTLCSTTYDENTREQGETRRHATVEVVLCGEDPGFPGVTEYYGLTNAHAVLSKNEQNRLSLYQADFNTVWKMISAQLTHLTVFLDKHNHGKVKTLDQLLYSYRREHNMTSNDLCWFESFLHDILVVKLDKDHLRRLNLLEGIEPVPNTYQLPSLQRHVTPANKLLNIKEKHTNILGILEVCTLDQLRLLESHQVTIMLLHKTGRVCPPLVVPSQGGINKSHCIYFVLDDGQGSLIEGNSGSAVYLLTNEPEPQLIILGLLVGKVNQSISDNSIPIYECTLLWPAIHHVMAQNSHKVTGLNVIRPCLRTTVTVGQLQGISLDSGVSA